MSVESIWMEIEEIGWELSFVEKGSAVYNKLVKDINDLAAELEAMGEKVDLTYIIN